MESQTKWERLEEFLFDHDKDGTDFSSLEYAAELDLDGPEASAAIQSYLAAQRSPKSKTLFVLRRQPGTRTSATRWAVGTRTRDARAVGKTLYSDVTARVRRAYAPDLVRIAAINPRAARQVKAQIDAIVDGAMKVLAAATEGMPFGDHDDE